MICRLAVLTLVLVIAGASPAWARSERVKVKVEVKVARSCTVHAPAARISSSGVPVIAVASLLADCTDESISALLTIVRDSADNRTDVATINF